MGRIIIYIIFSMNLLFSQLSWYNHPELNWKTIETDHFKIHFHQGTERSAREAATVAEYVYNNITSLYDFKPLSKTEIIIKDVDDYSNGSAYFYHNIIEIWAKPLDYDLRGSHRWMQDVISHEFTHIVQLGKSMKFTKFVPGSYIQMLSYEKEKRDDVLYGYPNQIVSSLIPGTAVPPWLAEGTAQHTYNEIFFDYWDSIRDMILRDQVINNNLFTFDEMNTFGKCGLGNELVYNHGYSLVEFIVKNFGENSLKKISSSLSNPINYSISKIIKNSLGISEYELYEQWKKNLIKKYSTQISNVEDSKNYLIIESEGTTNIHPRWSPNGKQIAFLSNKLNDYFSQTDLFIYDLEKNESEKLQGGVKSTPTWINDSLIVYTKRSKPDNNGSKFFDLYKYDFKKEEEERLSTGLRLFSPYYDKNNNRILAINTFDGTSNIVISNDDFSEFTQLTNFNNGIQIFSIATYKSKYIIDAVINHERNLYFIDSDSGKISIFIENPWDTRNPEYNNEILLYSDDKSGIYNIYYKGDLEEGYITNVVGGAFMPDISKDNKIVFSIYKNGGYKLVLQNEIKFLNKVGLDFEIGYDYYQRPTSILINSEFQGQAYDYQDKMTGPLIMPRLTFDYGTIKPGLYLFDSHTLNNASIFAGGSINSNKDIDLFLLFDYNKYKLNYYFNFYWLTRNTSRLHFYKRANGLYMNNLNFDVDYNYHLFASDIGTRFPKKNGGKFWLFHTYSHQRQYFDVIQTQILNEDYIEDFLFENETNYIFYDGAYDAFKGHAFTLKYEHDGRKKDYLYKMNTSKGIKINNVSISYEKNKFFEGYKVNEDTESIVPDLSTHNTFRTIFDISGYDNISFNNKETNINISYNIKYSSLSNKYINDFFYFFGGGLPGIKGYTFFDPILQGTELIVLTNQIRVPIFEQKSYGKSIFYINALSIGFIHQLAKANQGTINAKAMLTDISDNLLEDWLGVEIASGIEPFDALDRGNNIPNEYEDLIFVDVYREYDGYKLQHDDQEELEEFYNNAETVKSLKKRYSVFKQSIGIEFRLFGFTYYSYPMAITYEYHIPIEDPLQNKGRQYLKILFDF